MPATWSSNDVGDKTCRIQNLCRNNETLTGPACDPSLTSAALICSDLWLQSLLYRLHVFTRVHQVFTDELVTTTWRCIPWCHQQKTWSVIDRHTIIFRGYRMPPSLATVNSRVHHDHLQDSSRQQTEVERHQWQNAPSLRILIHCQSGMAVPFYETMIFTLP